MAGMRTLPGSLARHGLSNRYEQRAIRHDRIRKCRDRSGRRMDALPLGGTRVTYQLELRDEEGAWWGRAKLARLRGGCSGNVGYGADPALSEAKASWRRRRQLAQPAISPASPDALYT